jgi:ankyrin repeat protein
MAEERSTPSRAPRSAVSAAASRGPLTADAALLQYAEDGNLQSTRELLARGAAPDPRDAAGLTPLMLAVIHNHTAISDALIAHGAFVNSQSRAGLSPLMFAAINNRVTALGTLLKAGANPNAKTRAGWTALTYGAWHGHPEIVRLLLARGADARVIDRTGWTILDYASWRVLQPRSAYDPSSIVAGTVVSDADHAAVVALLQRAGARREHDPSS